MPAEHRLPEIKMPSSVRDAPEALEMMRVWWTERGNEMVLRPVFEDPRAFGFMLAEASKHLAQVYAAEKSMDPEEARRLVLQGWEDGQAHAQIGPMEVTSARETGGS